MRTKKKGRREWKEKGEGRVGHHGVSWVVSRRLRDFFQPRGIRLFQIDETHPCATKKSLLSIINIG
jgi:hypothetical protein